MSDKVARVYIATGPLAMGANDTELAVEEVAPHYYSQFEGSSGERLVICKGPLGRCVDTEEVSASISCS